MTNSPSLIRQLLQSHLFGLGLLTLLFFFRLGVPGLMDPDEGRYAEIAREMLVTGDFITPQLNFLPYLEKPPLVYWLTALCLSWGGLNEWAARTIPALSAVGGLTAVYWLTARIWDTSSAVISAAVTATSLGYLILGRILTLDMTLTCFMTWGIVLGYLAIRDKVRRYLPWAYGCLGLAVLSKGPVAVILPGLIFLAWLLSQKQWRGIVQLWHPGGMLIFLALVLPWYILVSLENPEFVSYFFLQENLQRFLTPRIHAGQPVYYYLGVLLVGCLPWTFLLPWAWLTQSGERVPEHFFADRMFLVCWFGVIVIFFSLSRAKLPPYVLPALPPAAIMLGRALGSSNPDPDGSTCRAWRLTLWLWFGLAVLLIVLLVGLPPLLPKAWDKIAYLAPLLWLFTLTLAATPTLLLLKPFSPRGRCRLLLAAALILNVILMMGSERLSEIRSPRQAAQVINSHMPPEGILLGYQLYSQGLSFYTGQPFYLYKIRGELDFGIRQSPHNPYYLNTEAELSELLHRRHRFFLLISPEELPTFQAVYSKPLRILTPWKKYLLAVSP